MRREANIDLVDAVTNGENIDVSGERTRLALIPTGLGAVDHDLVDAWHRVQRRKRPERASGERKKHAKAGCGGMLEIGADESVAADSSLGQQA